MPGTVIEMPRTTYSAKDCAASTSFGPFKISGTLEGLIDFAVPGGRTYPLSTDEALAIAERLAEAVTDVDNNCLYGADALLIDRTPAS